MRRLALLAVLVALSGCSNHLASLGETAGPQGTVSSSPAAVATAANGGNGEAATLVLNGIALDRVSDLPSPSQVSDEELLSVANPLIGKSVSIEGLRNLATAMETRFREAGYPYALVILPPQKVEGARVTFTLNADCIDGLRVLAPASPDVSQT